MQGARNFLVQLDLLTSGQLAPADRDLLDTVTNLFFATLEKQASDDVLAFGDVMERLAYRVETDARVAFAEQLAAAAVAPQRLILRLATDEIEVARPVLLRSVCLGTKDLVTIALDCKMAHLETIASRQRLQVPVTNIIIIARGSDAVLATLARNPDARLSWRGRKRLRSLVGGDAELLALINSRGWLQSDAIAHVGQFLRRWSWVKPAADDMHRAAGIIAESQRESPSAIERMGAGTADSPVEEAEELNAAAAKAAWLKADPPRAQKQVVTEAMLQEAAREGDVTESARCLAHLTHTSKAVARSLLHEAELPALAAVCRARDLSGATFVTLLQLRTAEGVLNGSHIAAAVRRNNAVSPMRAEKMSRALTARLTKQLENIEQPRPVLMQANHQ